VTARPHLVALLLGPWLGAGCASADRGGGPERAAATYLDALARGDHAAARGVSIAEVRTSTFAPAVLPAGALEGARWEVALRDGRVLWLVEEQPGQWRVDDRLRLTLDAREPLGAARVFLRAALQRDLALVRRFLPEAERVRLADDSRLHAHLEALRGRLEQAQAGLARAVVAATDGDLAQIPYDTRRVLRLVREQGQWRVLDLE
jgi:hypothetical protein